MIASQERRLSRLERSLGDKRRTHYLWREWDETSELVSTRIRDMIARGDAKPFDRFIIFHWSDQPKGEGDQNPTAEGAGSDDGSGAAAC